MGDDIRTAFEKKGFKAQDQPPTPRSQNPPPRSQAPATPARRFVLEENYASQAEKVILDLKNSNDRRIRYDRFSTSKIRNILGMVSDIYNDVLMEKGEKLTPEMHSRVEYMKVRLVYECGRERETVKPFVDRAGLLELIGDIGDSREKFVDFARYMEALVAYHRFHGGSEI